MPLARLAVKRVPALVDGSGRGIPGELRGTDDGPIAGDQRGLAALKHRGFYPLRRSLRDAQVGPADARPPIGDQGDQVVAPPHLADVDAGRRPSATPTAGGSRRGSRSRRVVAATAAAAGDQRDQGQQPGDEQHRPRESRDSTAPQDRRRVLDENKGHWLPHGGRDACLIARLAAPPAGRATSAAGAARHC